MTRQTCELYGKVHRSLAPTGWQLCMGQPWLTSAWGPFAYQVVIVHKLFSTAIRRLQITWALTFGLLTYRSWPVITCIFTKPLITVSWNTYYKKMLEMCIRYLEKYDSIGILFIALFLDKVFMAYPFSVIYSYVFDNINCFKAIFLN